MDEYWIHCSPIEPGGRPRFSVFQVDEGRQRILTPPGRLSAPADVITLLLDRGADRSGAERAIADAARAGLGRVVVEKSSVRKRSPR
jgi:hypothetical protein